MRTRLYPAIPDSAVHPRLTIGSLTRRGFGGGGMSAWCRPGPSAGIAASAGIEPAAASSGIARVERDGLPPRFLFDDEIASSRPRRR